MAGRAINTGLINIGENQLNTPRKRLPWYRACFDKRAVYTPFNNARRKAEKLTTSHLARKLGVESGILLNRLIGRGFIELKDGRKHLTPVGKRAGGEEIVERTKGSLIVWPQDLIKELLD